MAVHYFHCTDGVDLIVDRAGRETGAPSQLHRLARTVADEIMAAVPAYRDWADWAVHVYDERGEVAIVPFETEPVSARLQNTASSKTGSTERCHASSNRRSRRPARVSPASTIASSGSRKRASSRPASSR